MENFNLLELLTEQIRPRAAEGESTFQFTTYAPTRATSVESLHSFKWKPALRAKGKEQLIYAPTEKNYS